MDLAALRNKVKASLVKTGNASANYPFYSAPVDTNSIIRFLPFKNEEAGLFWAELHRIPLSFEGIEGEDFKPFTIKIPSATQYGMKDKIIQHLYPFWDEDKETARKYYFKRSFAMYGFVQKSPFEEVNTEDVRRFYLNNSIFQKVKDGLLDEDMGLQNHPCDAKIGTDFCIKKVQKGQYSNYDNSGWMKKETPLTKAQAAKELLSVSDFTGDKPTEELWDTYYEMFLASLAGDLYKPEWLELFKPWGYDKN